MNKGFQQEKKKKIHVAPQETIRKELGKFQEKVVRKNVNFQILIFIGSCKKS